MLYIEIAVPSVVSYAKFLVLFYRTCGFSVLFLRWLRCVVLFTVFRLCLYYLLFMCCAVCSVSFLVGAYIIYCVWCFVSYLCRCMCCTVYCFSQILLVVFCVRLFVPGLECRFPFWLILSILSNCFFFGVLREGPRKCLKRHTTFLRWVAGGGGGYTWTKQNYL